MIGKVMSAIIFIFTVVYLMLFTTLYFMHQSIRENINELNYQAAEIVSTSGVMTYDLYEYLYENSCKYGNYIIELRLDKRIKQGVYDTFFGKDEVVGKYLEVGDRVTIYLEDRELTLFGRLVNVTFLFYKPEKYKNTQIKSIKTAVVAKNSKNLVKGYDVIADIENNELCGKFTANGVAVFVSTKMNPSGKHYGLEGHESIRVSNLHYGDSLDEEGNTGINYIFDNGGFLKETEYYTNGMEKLIRYIQQ